MIEITGETTTPAALACTSAIRPPTSVTIAGLPSENARVKLPGYV